MKIEDLNNWLEYQASAWDDKIKKDKSLSGASWPEYFRGLKDLDRQKYFTISSCSFLSCGDDNSSPLLSYLDENKDKYNIVGQTGFCEFFKLK